MYIEFDILGAEQDFDTLIDAIQHWAQHHQVRYRTKVVKNLRLRLGLDWHEHYTLFFLTWNGSCYQVKNADKT